VGIITREMSPTSSNIIESPGKIIAFSGSISSGKTTISSLLADTLGWKWVSFGEYVRKIARSQSIGNSRKELQAVSDSLVQRGWETFCTSILEEVQWNRSENLVIDGIRHREAIETLRTLCYPAKVFLVYLSITQFEQLQRTKEKGISNISELQDIESHSSEVQVYSNLRRMADLIVDEDLPKHKLVQMIKEWVISKTDI